MTPMPFDQAVAEQPPNLECRRPWTRTVLSALSRWRNLRAPDDRPVGCHEAAAHQLTSREDMTWPNTSLVRDSGCETRSSSTRAAEGKRARRCGIRVSP